MPTIVTGLAAAIRRTGAPFIAGHIFGLRATTHGPSAQRALLAFIAQRAEPLVPDRQWLPAFLQPAIAIDLLGVLATDHRPPPRPEQAG